MATPSANSAPNPAISPVPDPLPNPPRPVTFGRGGLLSGAWRGPDSARQIWILLPPWAEEDKSARRTLTEGAQHLARQGDASLIFSTRGQGDSRGDFSHANLDAWIEDLQDAIAHARAVYPDAPLCAVGVRGGALLLLELARRLEESKESGAPSLPIFERVVLIEPILQGKRVLSELQARQKLRAGLTQQEAQAASAVALRSPTEAPQVLDEAAPPRESPQVLAGAVDFDGWAWGQDLRDDVKSWDANSVSAAPLALLARRVDALQVGPRESLLPALEQWCQARQVEASALRAQPFWNLLDHAGSSEMWRIIAPETTESGAPTFARAEAASVASTANAGSEQAIAWLSGAHTLCGVLHRAAIVSVTCGGADAGEGDPRRGTVVFLHGWSGYKSGPHQMLARAARSFSALGFDSVRFDFAGRGDSDGDASLSTLATMSEDTRTVLQWCQERAQSGEKIILIGLCSGCEVAVGSVGSGVAAMALWSAPVFAAQASASRDNRKRLHHLSQYARKLLRPATYLKLLRGEVDAKAVASVAKAKGGESKNIESGQPGQLPRGWRAQVLERFNSWLMSNRPLLLVYGTADPATEEALSWYRAQPGASPSTHLVEGANHSYYGLAWEREVFEATAKWLDDVA